MSDTVMVAAIAAIGPILTVAVAAVAVAKKLNTIHDLANSRLTVALRKIAKLERMVGVIQARKR